ncbi:MAG: aminotransferase class V-fold PLP-dependent enzyme, partial [Nanoarchaeota archaeon]|nr:aminotransferase class V-fold PLP-dependent enzyme [Nanoarchaeota archaeon]
MKYKEVYLDNGATTKTDSKVLEVMKPWFCKNYGNSSSLHKKGIHSKETLEKSRSIIAKRINALPEEIIFTTGGSESNNLAIKGVAQIHKTGHIITSKIEHPSVIETCKFLRKQGFEITFLDVNKDGFINLKQLENSITKRTILVTIMHANNEIGTIQPIEKIGKLCKEKQVLFHTDAVQSFTKEKIDVKKANIDLMSLSAHKIHGP